MNRMYVVTLVAVAMAAAPAVVREVMDGVCRLRKVKCHPSIRDGICQHCGETVGR